MSGERPRGAGGYLPIEYDVRGRAAAVLGGDAVLVPKIERLLSAGALVTVYLCDEQPSGELAAVCRERAVAVHARAPRQAELDAACVTFASPGLAQNAELASWARASGRLFCAVDRIEHATFASPAAAVASGIGIRVFSGGISPGLSMRLKDEIARALADPRFERLVQRLGALRSSLRPGERTPRMRAALEGVAVEVRLRLPTDGE